MIYHYTQLKNFDKIFTKDHIVLRMYDSRWMNDPSESKVLQEYLTHYQEEISALLPEKVREIFKSAIKVSVDFTPKNFLPNFFYVLSFSGIRDSNMFWGSSYSGLNGFSVSIEESELVVTDGEKSIGHSSLNEVYYFKSIEGEVNIDDIEHVAEKLKHIVTSLESGDEKPSETDMPYALWDNIINFMCIFYKHPSWSHEKEKRFVVVRKSMSNFLGWVSEGKFGFLPSGIGNQGLNVYHDCKIDFSNNVNPRPYIEIQFDKKVINQVTLGPALKEIDLEAVRNYFYVNNYVIDVHLSGAQIR